MPGPRGSRRSDVGSRQSAVSTATTSNRSTLLAGVDVASSGGPVALDPVATTGVGTFAAQLVRIGIVVAATTGVGATAATIRKVGTLVAATLGASQTSALLVGRLVVQAATSGRSSLAAVLIEIDSLSVLSAGQTSMTAAAVAVKPLVMASVGQSAMGAAITGQSLGPIATGGASAMDAQLEGGAVEEPSIGVVGGSTAPFGSHFFPTEELHEADSPWRSLGEISTSGASEMACELEIVRAETPAVVFEYVPPVGVIPIRPRYAHDPALAIALALEAA